MELVTMFRMDLALKICSKTIHAVVWEHIIYFIGEQIEFALNWLSFCFCSLSVSTAKSLQVS